MKVVRFTVTCVTPIKSGSTRGYPWKVCNVKGYTPQGDRYSIIRFGKAAEAAQDILKGSIVKAKVYGEFIERSWTWNGDKYFEFVPERRARIRMTVVSESSEPDTIDGMFTTVSEAMNYKI